MHTANASDEVARTATDRVLDALAAKERCDPAEFSTPLYDVVDPDALDEVLSRDSSNHEVYVGFSFEGHGVQVHGDGTVYVDSERYDPATGAFENA